MFSSNRVQTARLRGKKAHFQVELGVDCGGEGLAKVYEICVCVFFVLLGAGEFEVCTLSAL